MAEKTDPRAGGAGVNDKRAAGQMSNAIVPPHLPRYTGADDEKVAVAYSRNKLDERHSHWQNKTPTRADIISWSADPYSLQGNKYAAGGFLAARLGPGPGRTCKCTEKIHKTSDTVESCSFLALDPDKPDDGFVDRVKALGYSGVLYPSASSSDQRHKYRLIQWTDRDMTPAERETVALYIQHRIDLDRPGGGTSFDPQSHRAVWTMYRPAIDRDEGNTPEHFAANRHVLSGSLIDVDAVLSEVERMDLMGPLPWAALHPSKRSASDPVDTSTPATAQERQRAEALLETWANNLETHAEGDSTTRGRNDYLLSKSTTLYRWVLGGCLEEAQVQDRMREAYQLSGVDRDDFEHTDNNAMSYADDAGAARPRIELAADVFDALEPEDGRCLHVENDGTRCQSGRMSVDGAPISKWCRPHAFDHPDEDEEIEEASTTWKRLDVGAVLDQIAAGEVVKVMPTVGAMTLGGCLFYSGRINTVFGESGSAKTWLVLLAAKQEIEAGRPVFFIDFEDDVVSTLQRLIAIGTDVEAVRERFHYISPDEKLSKALRKKLIRTLDAVGPSLVVIDSTGESLALEGKNPNADEEVATWIRLLPKAATHCGAAVVVVDHVPKAEGGNGAPIGSQRKKAGTFSAYRVESVVEFSKASAGYSRVVAIKDKGGNHRKDTTIAELHAMPADDCLSMRLEQLAEQSHEDERDEKLERAKRLVSQHVERMANLYAESQAEVEEPDPHGGLTRDNILKGIRDSGLKIETAVGRDAINALVADGCLVPTVATAGERYPRLTHGDRYSEPTPFDAVADDV